MVENANAFYRNLFTKDKYKKDFQRLPKLNEKMKDEQKKIVTEEEIEKNLMDGNKSPGNDGIPAKF
eukprot:Pgem_evm2s4369